MAVVTYEYILHEKGKHAFIGGNVALVLPVLNMSISRRREKGGRAYVQTAAHAVTLKA